MGAVAYFTAVIARSGTHWRAVDVDVEDAESLDELAELLRAASRGGPVLAVLEREDDWFALVRVDEDDDEARSFVSDLAATERSHYADVLSPIGDIELGEYAHLRVPQPPAIAEGVSPVAYAASDELDDAEAAPPTSGTGTDGELLVVGLAPALAPPPWAGDPGLLADVGVDAEELVDLVDQREGDPASVIAALGERCGFDELLDALR